MRKCWFSFETEWPQRPWRIVDLCWILPAIKLNPVSDLDFTLGARKREFRRVDRSMACMHWLYAGLFMKKWIVVIFDAWFNSSTRSRSVSLTRIASFLADLLVRLLTRSFALTYSMVADRTRPSTEWSTSTTRPTFHLDDPYEHSLSSWINSTISPCRFFPSV